MKPIPLALLSLTLTLAGCGGCAERYVEPQGPVSPFRTPQRDYILAIAIDTSSSCLDEMFGKNGRGYEFALTAVHRLFQDRMGSNDHVLFAQLSSNRNALLWEGTPRSLMKRFGSSDGLRDFIVGKSNSRASHLYAGIAQTLTYLNNLPGVKEGKTPICILILSDMDDNSPSQAEDKRKMIEAMRMFKDVPGGIGFYFVDANRIDDVRTCMTEAGIDSRFIESGIMETAPLPTFTDEP